MSDVTSFYKAVGISEGEKLNLLNEDCPLPAMVLKQEVIFNNSKWMQIFADRAGVKLAPHGKTTMSPELFKIQLEQGAWGMTLANPFQVKVAYQHGVRRILMANQLVGRQNIKSMVNLLKADRQFEFLCCVDSFENAQAIQEVCISENLERPFKVLIEIGPKSGRAGLRSSQEVMELAQAIQMKLNHLELAGIECYEGVIHGKNAVEEVKTFLKEVSQTCVELEQASLFNAESLILTGGGTVFFDLVAEILTQTPLKTTYEVLIRPGCYLSHDSGLYDNYQNELLSRSELARSIPSSLCSAIEVLCYVQSIPEANVAILNVGKRDVSFDSGLPKPEKVYSVARQELQALDEQWSLSDLNDQHAFMNFSTGSDIKVGDIVVLSVSHPCLTFDKWQSILMVDEHYQVQSQIKTFFG